MQEVVNAAGLLRGLSSECDSSSSFPELKDRNQSRQHPSAKEYYIVTYVQV